MSTKKQVFTFKKGKKYHLDAINQVGNLIASVSEKAPDTTSKPRNLQRHGDDLSSYDMFTKTVKVTIEITD